MRNLELIKWNNLWKLKSQILPDCLYGKYGAQLGEFTNNFYFFALLKGLRAEIKFQWDYCKLSFLPSATFILYSSKS